MDVAAVRDDLTSSWGRRVRVVRPDELQQRDGSDVKLGVEGFKVYQLDWQCLGYA